MHFEHTIPRPLLRERECFCFCFFFFCVSLTFPQKHPVGKAGRWHEKILKDFLWHIMPSVFPLQPWEVLQGWGNWLCCLMGDNISLWPYAWRVPPVFCAPLASMPLIKSALHYLHWKLTGAAGPYLQWPRRAGINHQLQRKKLASEQSPHNLQMINSQPTHFWHCRTMPYHFEENAWHAWKGGSVARHTWHLHICKPLKRCCRLRCYASVAFLIVAVFLRKTQLAIHNEPDLANYLAHCLVQC